MIIFSYQNCVLINVRKLKEIPRTWRTSVRNWCTTLERRTNNWSLHKQRQLTFAVHAGCRRYLNSTPLYGSYFVVGWSWAFMHTPVIKDSLRANLFLKVCRRYAYLSLRFILHTPAPDSCSGFFFSVQNLYTLLPISDCFVRVHCIGSPHVLLGMIAEK